MILPSSIISVIKGSTATSRKFKYTSPVRFSIIKSGPIKWLPTPEINMDNCNSSNCNCCIIIAEHQLNSEAQDVLRKLHILITYSSTRYLFRVKSENHYGTQQNIWKNNKYIVQNISIKYIVRAVYNSRGNVAGFKLSQTESLYIIDVIGPKLGNLNRVFHIS